MACGAWAAPEAVWEDTAGPRAVHGSDTHAVVAGEKLPSDVPEAARVEAAHVRRWVDAHPAVMQHEVAYAWDPATDTARILHVGGKRDYSTVREDELPGASDLVWLDASASTVYILDIKTGEADDVEENLQLRTLALMAARAHGASKARVGLLFVRPEGVVEPAWATMSEWDLDAHAADLREAIARIGSAPTPGAHCRWCPHRAHCPSTMAALAAAPSFAITTEEDIRRVYPRLGAIEDALRSIRDRIKAHVEEHGPIPLADGKLLRVIEVSGRESVAIKDIPREVAEDLRSNGIIKKGAPSKQLREVKAA